MTMKFSPHLSDAVGHMHIQWLTIWANESHATDFWGIAGCVDSGYISSHGGSHQMERFPVQANGFHKLRRMKDKNRFFTGMINRNLTHIVLDTVASLFIAPGGFFRPAPEWNNPLCWCVLFPRGQACPHTQGADVLVDTGAIEETKYGLKPCGMYVWKPRNGVII